MESPIQKDGAPQDANPAGPDTKVTGYPEGHPSIHDSRQAIMDQAASEEEARRTGENAAQGFDVTAEPEPGPPAPADDSLDGVRGKEGYIPDRSQPQGQEPTIARPEEGLKDVQPMHEEEPASTVPEGYENDPYADLLVEDPETKEVFFKAKVNGKEEYIPYEKAMRSIQIHESADQRLQEANQVQQQLATREQTIAAREQDLQTRLESMHTPTQEVQPSPDAGLTDEELLAKSKEIVSGLFTEDQETASAKLAEVLKETRGAAATPQVDPDAIAAQAVTAAREQLSAEAVDRDVKAGYTKFTEDYPDIAEDDRLFQVADGMTDTIRTEHPDWMPSQVMLEAGKRTRELVKSFKGETSEQPTQPNDRQERKRQLRPIPRVRAGTQEKEPEERPETPADVLADIRASRGQVA